ncbi:MAG TPA: DUF4118 domain-containing protein [Acidimicrobiales bacterium]|nr:DUF4118 domain-containing protein [Acidimicrobiales bacterium]
MRSQGEWPTASILAGIVTPLLVALALVPVRTSFAAPAAALVLVAVVVAVAVLGNRWAGVLAAISAAAWFDFFLTRPYERFTISHRSDLETAISLLVVGLAVTELAARNRLHHSRADERMDFVAMIYGLAELVATGAGAATVIDRASLELTQLLHLQECRFETGTGHSQADRIEHNGEITRVDRAIGAEPADGALELEVENAGLGYGRFILLPTPGWPLSVALRLTAIAIADQVGAALAGERRSA